MGELSLAEVIVVKNPALSEINDIEFDRTVHQLNQVVNELQIATMSLRMIQIAPLFRKMVRLVHDLSNKFNKKIKLVTEGEETEIDKTVMELIIDPVIHIVRNAIDHGIETPEERKKSGKSEFGSLIIEGRQESGEVRIIIKDDGRGLSREKILNKAISNGLYDGDGAGLSDSSVFKFILEPGFSTVDKVTEISGRGVGMDVVKKNLEEISGRVDIQSIYGEGTIFTLRIPLTLAIIEGMLVRVGSSRYIIPLLSIMETFRPEPDNITRTPKGKEIVKVRDSLIPVIRLHEIFEIIPDSNKLEEGLLIIVENHGELYGFAIDEVLGKQKNVVKSISDYLGKVKGVSGCTILGDGMVSMILDVGHIINDKMERNCDRE